MIQIGLISPSSCSFQIKKALDKVVYVVSLEYSWQNGIRNPSLVIDWFVLICNMLMYKDPSTWIFHCPLTNCCLLFIISYRTLNFLTLHWFMEVIDHKFRLTCYWWIQMWRWVSIILQYFHTEFSPTLLALSYLGVSIAHGKVRI